MNSAEDQINSYYTVIETSKLRLKLDAYTHTMVGTWLMLLKSQAMITAYFLYSSVIHEKHFTQGFVEANYNRRTPLEEYTSEFEAPIEISRRIDLKLL